MAPRLLRLLIHKRYDVVHTHLLGANLLGLVLAAFQGVPLRLTHDHTHDEFRSLSVVPRWLDAQANRLNHHVIAVSSSIRAFLCREEGVSADKISVIYNAVDLLRFSPNNDLTAPQRGGGNGACRLKP
jgi:glycosyltransferase involved in cell wall biosynthesis